MPRNLQSIHTLGKKFLQPALPLRLSHFTKHSIMSPSIHNISNISTRPSFNSLLRLSNYATAMSIHPSNQAFTNTHVHTIQIHNHNHHRHTFYSYPPHDIPNSPVVDPHAPTKSSSSFYVTYHELEAVLAKRGYSLYWLLVGTAATVAVSLYYNWNHIKLWGAQESADVARQTLEDEELRRKAGEVATQVVNALLTDKEFFEKVKSLTINIMQDEASAEALQIFAARCLKNIMQDEQIKAHAAVFVADVLNYDVVRQSAANLASWVVVQPYVIEKGKEHVSLVLQDPTTRHWGKDYATWAALETLKDVKTTQYAKDVASSILNDPTVQDNASNAIWNAAKSLLNSFAFWNSSPKQIKTSLDNNSSNDTRNSEVQERNPSPTSHTVRQTSST